MGPIKTQDEFLTQLLRVWFELRIKLTANKYCYRQHMMRNVLAALDFSWVGPHKKLNATRLGLDGNGNVLDSGNVEFKLSELSLTCILYI